jgi:hypothetical protein
MWVGIIFERSISFSLVPFLRISNILLNFYLFIDEFSIILFVLSEITPFYSIILVLFLNENIMKNHLFEKFVDILLFFDKILR